MKYLVLTMASWNPGDSDIASFSSVSDLSQFVMQMAQGGAYKIIVYERQGATDVGGGGVWSPEDEISGDRLYDIAKGNKGYSLR